jgi:polysaccharide deacetylase 2 family uncharacterized protein YibQ
VTHARQVFSGRLRGPDVHAAINLPRIAREQIQAEASAQFHGESGFPGRGWAEKNRNPYFVGGGQFDILQNRGLFLSVTSRTREYNIGSTKLSARPHLIALSAAVGIVLILCAGAFVARKTGTLHTLLRGTRDALLPSNRDNGKNTTQPGRLPIESTLRKKLSQLEARPGDIASETSPQDRSLIIKAAVPKGKPFEWIIHELSAATDGTPYRVADCVVDEKKSSCTISYASPAKYDPAVMLQIATSDKYLSGTAEIALVVENLEDTAYQIAVSVLSFPDPLTISLAPAGKKASLIAQLAEQYKKEVVVRLGLEPPGKPPVELAKSVIMVHYPEKTIHFLVADAARRFPEINGFSNLWSSRALEDTRVMTAVMEEAKKRHAYFLESKPARNSVAGAVAAKLGVPYECLSLRIEKTSAADIVAEIKRYAAAAQTRGALVLSCQGTRALADALKTAIPFLRQNGIRLVFVSEIVKRTPE